VRVTLAGRTVLVTGAAGFLGSHLSESLVREGAHVRALDDGSSGDPDHLRAVRHALDWVEGDVRDAGVLGPLVEGADVVFHLAARVGEAASCADPLGSHSVNAQGTLAVLEAARALGTPRVVYASSWRVYGARRDRPLVETLPPAPDSPYAVQKQCGEVYAALYTRLHALPTVSLRYFPIFGPRQRAENGYATDVLAFARAQARGEAAALDSSGASSVPIDLLYVEDAVRAARLAAESERAVGNVVNVGSGRPAGSCPAFQALAAGSIVERPRVADLARADEQLGFGPGVSVEDGLSRTIEWLRATTPGDKER
jgi:UDP-glucose 4-epimerase